MGSRARFSFLLLVSLFAAAVTPAAPVEDPATAPGPAELTAEEAAAAPRPASERLRALSGAQRDNARLGLEPLSDLTDPQRLQAAQVEQLWGEGRYDLAVDLLAQVEAGGASFAATIAWRQPVVSEQELYYPDVRIGSPRVDATEVALDFDRVTGNLLAAVQWAGTETEMTVNISTDNGASWAETWSYGAEGQMDATVYGPHLYLAYSPSIAPSVVRVRRFLVADGSYDSGYGLHDVADVSPDTILDVAAGSNADRSSDPDDGRLFFSFVRSDNTIGLYWSDTYGSIFFNMGTPVTNAAASLDFHWAATFGSRFWLAYYGTEGNPHALFRNSDHWEAHDFASPVFGTRVRISAHGEHAYLVYGMDYTNGYGVEVRSTHNLGDTWSAGIVYIPDAGEASAYGADVTIRSGAGAAVIFNREDGTVDQAYLSNHAGWDGGAWPDPQGGWTNHDAQSGAKSFIQYLGSRCLQCFGLVYLAYDTDPIPYFDLSSPRAFFCNGFESGNTAGWSAVQP